MTPAATDPKLMKVCLTNQGEDTETPWAHDLGPAPNAVTGARKVRLANVPFMHAKPTWGDVIVVHPTPDGFPTWDRGGVAWKQIGTRIVEDGGRWAMIVDYVPDAGTAPETAVAELTRACNTEDVVAEGAWGPRDGEPGRVYLAVQKQLTAELVMQKLLSVKLPMRLIQVHPEPKKLPRAQTVHGVTPDRPRKPAADEPTGAAAARPATKSARPGGGAATKPAAHAASSKPTPPKSASTKPAPPATHATKASTTAASKPVAKPVATPAATRAAKTAAKPTGKTAPKPTARAAPKPTAKTAAKPTARAAAKPTAKAAGKAKPAAKAGAKKR